MIEKIHKHIDQNFKKHLVKIQDFVRQPSISADGTGMKEMADKVVEYLTVLGAKAELVPTKGYPVVLGELNVGAPKTLLIYGMYDVQPVKGEEWEVPPFSGEIVDLPDIGSAVVSRGIYNSKGPLVAAFNVLQSIQAVTKTLPVNLKFVIEGEEELGSKHLPEFVEQNKGRLKADWAFFPFFCQDRAGKPILHLGVKGIVFLELVCHGGLWGGPMSHAVHGSNAVWFHNPAWVLIHALSSMITPDQKHLLIEDFYDDVLPPSVEDEELLDKLAKTFNHQTHLEENEVMRFKYDLKGVELLRQYLYQPSLNIDGFITGHTQEGSKTILPHEARAKVDIRLVPKMNPEKVIQQIRRHLEKSYFEQIEIILHESYPWSKTSVRTPVAQALIETYRSLDLEPEIWPHTAGSAPFYLFTEVLNIPIVAGGLGHGGRAHSPNEYATVSGIKLFEKSIATFLYKLAEWPETDAPNAV